MKLCVYTSVKRMKDKRWGHEIKSQLQFWGFFGKNFFPLLTPHPNSPTPQKKIKKIKNK